MALPFGLKTGLTAKTLVGTIGEDGKRVDDEYSARCLAHAVVYQKNGKPMKTAEVDERIKEQLIGTMLAGVAAGQVEIAPPAEEPAVPQIPEGNIVVDEAATLDEEAVKAAEQIIANQAGNANVEFQTTPPAPNPFYNGEPTEAMQPIVNEVLAKEAAAPESPFGVSPLANAPIEDNLGFDTVEAPTIDYEELLAEAEARSVENANLKVLVDALYRRFNIYLPFVNAPPRRSDISPINGAVMNALTYGQAVQGFKSAQRLGTSWNPVEIRAQLNSSRSSSQQHDEMPRQPEEAVQEVVPYGQPLTGMPDNLHGEPSAPAEPDMPRELRRFASPHKSAQQSEHGKERDGLDPDELYAEPPINAQNPIVRPFVTNKRSQAKLEEINRQRLATVPQNLGYDSLV